MLVEDRIMSEEWPECHCVAELSAISESSVIVMINIINY